MVQNTYSILIWGIVYSEMIFQPKKSQLVSFIFFLIWSFIKRPPVVNKEERGFHIFFLNFSKNLIPSCAAVSVKSCRAGSYVGWVQGHCFSLEGELQTSWMEIKEAPQGWTGVHSLLLKFPNEARWDFTTEPPESERPEARGSQGCEGRSGNGSGPGGRDRFGAESFEPEKQVVSWAKWHKDINLTESTELSGTGPSQKPAEEAARTAMAHTSGQNSSRTKKGSRSMIQL